MVIYITTHTTTNKKYIGKDKNNNPRYFGSGVNIKKIIKSEGVINLKREILEYCSDVGHMVEREIYWLEKYNVKSNPQFLNKTNKAFGNSGQTEEGKIKISQALKGKKQSIKTRKLKSNSLKNYWMNISLEEREERGSKTKIGRVENGGYKHTEETKNKISYAKKGNTHRRKTVYQYNKNFDYIRSFPSVAQAAGFLNKKTGAAITEVCSGKRKSIYGYIWSYSKI